MMKLKSKKNPRRGNISQSIFFLILRHTVFLTKRQKAFRRGGTYIIFFINEETVNFFVNFFHR